MGTVLLLGTLALTFSVVADEPRHETEPSINPTEVRESLADSVQPLEDRFTFKGTGGPLEWAKLAEYLKTHSALRCTKSEKPSALKADEFLPISAQEIPSSPFLRNREALSQAISTDRKENQGEGLARYDILVGTDAAKALEAAVAVGDFKLLDDIVYQYPYTAKAMESALLLARFHLDGGRSDLAFLYAEKAIEYAEARGQLAQIQPEVSVLAASAGLNLHQPKLFDSSFEKYQLGGVRLRQTEKGKEISTQEELRRWLKEHGIPSQKEPTTPDYSQWLQLPRSSLGDWYFRVLRLSGKRAFEVMGDADEKTFRSFCLAMQLEEVLATARDDGKLETLLQGMASPLLRKAILKQSRNKESSVTEKALLYLKTADPDGNEAIPLLTKLILEDKESSLEAVQALGKYTEKPSQVIDPLLHILNTKGYQQLNARLQAMALLGTLKIRKTEIVDALFPHLESLSWDEKREAAMALAHFPDISTKKLIEELKTPQHLLLSNTLLALSYLGEAGRESFPHLKDYWEKSRNAENRRQIMAVMKIVDPDSARKLTTSDFESDPMEQTWDAFEPITWRLPYDYKKLPPEQRGPFAIRALLVDPHNTDALQLGQEALSDANISQRDFTILVAAAAESSLKPTLISVLKKQHLSESDTNKAQWILASIKELKAKGLPEVSPYSRGLAR